MPIGNNTFWIILQVTRDRPMPYQAELQPNDKRQALKFTSREAAERYIAKNLNELYCACEVRG